MMKSFVFALASLLGGFLAFGGDVYYVDCTFKGNAKGTQAAPFKSIHDACAAVTDPDATIYVCGGPDRKYEFQNYYAAGTITNENVRIIGCDADWNPASHFTDTNAMAVIAVSDAYAQNSYNLTKSTFAAPFLLKASGCTISGLYARFGAESLAKSGCGGTGLISLAEGISGTTVENCYFTMTNELGAAEGAGTKGVIAGSSVNSAAKQISGTVIRRCYFRLAKYQASTCAFWNLHNGTRFEENLVENVDTLFSYTSTNVSGGELQMISNVCVNCANGSPEGSNTWLIVANGTLFPNKGVIAYNRFIHNDGSEERYRLFAHGQQYNGNWTGDTLIHHNVIVGYDVAFESPSDRGTGAAGVPWAPRIFDNLIVDTDYVFSEDANNQWTKSSVSYKSSFLPGSLFASNAVWNCTGFVTGTATSQSWYDIYENLAGARATRNLTAAPQFADTTDPLSGAFYRLRLVYDPWATAAYVGDDPTFPEFPRYIGALPPQPKGFAARIR